MSAERKLMEKHNALFVAAEFTAMWEWRVVIRKSSGPDIELARAPYRWLALRRALAVRKTPPYRCTNCGTLIPETSND